MATYKAEKDYNLTLATKPIGFKTLFVNSKESQIIPYKYGLPLQTDITLYTNFTGISPGVLTKDDIRDADLLRYNLGRFFYGNEKTYQFIEARTNVKKSGILPNPDKPVLNPKEYVSPLRYQIFKPDAEPAVNLEDFLFTNKTMMTLKFNAHEVPLHMAPGKDEGYIYWILDRLYGAGIGTGGSGKDPSDDDYIGNPFDAFTTYLSQGKTRSPVDGNFNYSPQYLGLTAAAFAPTAIDLPDPAYAPEDKKLPFAPPATNDDTTLIYNDHSFVFSHPYGKNKTDDLGSVKILYHNIISDYNFYQAKYEQALNIMPNEITSLSNLSDLGIPIDTSKHPAELLLPNFMVVLEETKTVVSEDEFLNQQYNSNSNYAFHSTLGGRLPINTLRPLQTQEKDYEEVVGTFGNQYLDAWSSVVNKYSSNVTNDSELTKVALKFKNIIYSLDVLKNEDTNISKKSFPFYNEINFNTDTSNQVADILKSSKLFDLLVVLYSGYTQGFFPDEGYVEMVNFHPYQELIETTTGVGNQTAIISSDDTQFPLSKVGTPYRTFDFETLIEELLKIETVPALSAAISQAITAGGETYDQSYDIFKGDPLAKLISKMTFMSNYASFIKNNLRTYEDIATGVPAYSETLFYRVEKTDSTGNIIQNFYVLNDSELENVNLVDTQIKYGKEYNYQIYAIQLVLGNEYYYAQGPPPIATDKFGGTGVSQNPYQVGKEYRFNLDAISKQSIKLIELPYTGKKSIKAQEQPPVPPEINFVPYRNIDNKILITFNVGIGEYYDSYIPITGEDSDIIENSSIVDNKGQVLFKTEGDVTGYEMFRISEVEMPDGPKSYSDFGTKDSVKRVLLNRELGEPTFIDTLRPNTKYWYTFRTNDKKHSSSEMFPDFSNPTDVYEIQLINNSGAIYLIMQTYDIGFFDKQRLLLQKTKTKTMRKYLHIKPSFEQTILNSDPEFGGSDYTIAAMVESTKDYVEKDKNDDVSEFKLGYKEKSIFGNSDNDTNNRFKVRLTSKKTGRRIDIFLRFKKPTLEK